MKTRRLVQMLVISLGLIWGGLFICAPQGWQSRLFYAQGRELMSDYMLPRSCAGDVQPYRPQDVMTKDACYPALALVLVRPFSLSQNGAILFTSLASILLLCAVGLFASIRGGQKSVLLAIATTMMSSPFIFNFERGNLMCVAAAGVLVFLAWYDADTGWKRGVAAFALACAGVLKIVPALLGLIYFERRQWREMAMCAGMACVLFFVPFVWYGGWENGVLQWIANAAENASWYMSRTAWGLVPVDRAVRMALHMPITDGWPGIWVSRGLSISMALGCLVLFFLKRNPMSIRILFLAAALMMGSAAMMYYTGMLLAAAFLWNDREMHWVEGVLWVLLFSPLQLRFGAFETGRHVSNLAFLALVAWQAWGQFRTRNRS